jgi:hypothetical protein
LYSIPGSFYVLQLQGSPDAYEPDDTAATAYPILLNDQNPEHTLIPGYKWKQLHNFGKANDQDWVIYYAHARGGDKYKIEVSSPGAKCDAVIAVFSGDDLNNPIQIKDDRPAGQAEYLEWEAAKDGLYYIRIKPYDGSVFGDGTNYELVLSRPAATFTGFVYGTVSPGVRTILTTDGGGEAISLPNGYFAMPHPAGTFTLTAIADGYPEYTQSITVNEIGETALNVNVSQVAIRPSVTITQPTTGPTYTSNSGSLTIEGTASGDVGVTHVTCGPTAGAAAALVPVRRHGACPVSPYTLDQIS